jgi:hypothetical protein
LAGTSRASKAHRRETLHSPGPVPALLGPGLCQLRRTPLWRSSQDPTSTHLGEYAAGCCLPLRFIVDSSPCVSLLGVSSTQLDNSSFQATNHNEHRNHIALKLLAEGSVVVLVMALGWWGMWNVGSSTLSSQSDSLTAHQDPIYVAGCPVPDPLQKSSRLGDVEEGKGCSEEDLSDLINTSRRPRGGLEGHALPTQRQREDKLSPPTSSEKKSSSHSGE